MSKQRMRQTPTFRQPIGAALNGRTSTGFASNQSGFIHLHVDQGGPGVAQWLRHCATTRAVPGSNPGGVGTGTFLVDTDRTMCPGVNSPSKKWVPGIPLVVKAVGAWCWRPTTLVVPNVKKSRALTYPDPLGPSRLPVVGETFTFTRWSKLSVV